MKTILCPIDFSPASANGLQYADQLAPWLAARLIMLHNVPEPAGSQARSIGRVLVEEPLRDPEQEQALLDRLESWKSNLPGSTGSKPVTYESRIRYGLTQENIAEEALACQADLIVLGRKQRHGLKQLLSGSVIGDVVRQAPCPVLIIPPDVSFQPWSRIVFATNLSGDDAPELRFLVQAAALFRAKVLFLHVLPENSALEQQEAEMLFQQFRQKFAPSQAELYIHTHENIEEGIGQFTWQHPADLLVMGCHRHTCWGSFVLGDATKQMAYLTQLPLLILHY